MTANGTLNGVPPHVREKLTEVLTEGYKPAVPNWATSLGFGDMMPLVYLWREVELMKIHQTVRNALRYFKGGIAGADFEGPKGLGGQPKPISKNPVLAEYVYDQCKRFWDRGVYKIQNGYDYGWIAVENLYGQVHGGELDGLWQWEGCLEFYPLDCFMLTHNACPIGARIMRVVPPESKLPAYRDLWFADGPIPAKALWYRHGTCYNRWYGQSQLLGAWKAWRRLAWKDAAETVLDAGFYRQGYGGPVIRYPEEDLAGPAGVPNTTMDASGQSRRQARDEARQMGQAAKSGATIGMPSTKFPQDMGGDFKWDFQWQDTHFNGSPLIEYVEHLVKQVREGVGVPSELIEAAETGSGYSGRAIPMEGFYMGQQEIANQMLHLFVNQCVRPLVAMNGAFFSQFGDLHFEVVVANLLETKQKAAMNPGGAAPEMQAGGALGAGPEEGGAGGAAAGAGVQWQPYSNPQSGAQGWESTGGLVRYTQQPPGSVAMSLGGDGRLLMARKILEAAKSQAA